MSTFQHPVAVDSDFNLPLEVRQALLNSPEFAAFLVTNTGPTVGKLLAPSLYAQLAAYRDARVIPFAVAGASVAAQITSDRWTYLFHKRLQAAYPKSSGTEQNIRTLSGVQSSPLTGQGAVVVNAAIAGSTTGSFLTATTRTQLMAINPAIVLIADMPANDYGAKVPPATVKANMIAQLTDLIAKENPLFPCQYVVVGGYYPTISGAIAPVDDYRAAMREAVATFPNKASWFDTYDEWIAIGVGPGLNDPLDIISTDNLHPNASGHRVLADMVSRLFALPDGLGTGVVVTAPTITTTSLNSMTVGATFVQTLAADGTSPITWARTAGAYPAGITMNSSGVISGTPSTAGAYNFTVSATNSAGTVTKVFSGTVASTATAPVIVTTTLGSIVTESPVSIQVAATGTTPIEYNLVGGAIPDGLNLSQGGAISGIATTVGSYSFTVRGTNSAGFDDQLFTGTITAPVINATIIASDGFSGTNGTSMQGRLTDSVAGGTQKEWAITGTWTVSSAKLVNNSAAGGTAALIDMGVSNNVQVSSILSEWISGTGFYIEMFRLGASNAFLFGINSAGVLSLAQSTTGSIATFTQTAAELVGKRLRLRYFEGRLSCWIDNTKIHEVIVAASGATTAGYSKSGAVNIKWDDFQVETLSLN